MRLTVAILLFACMHVAASGHTQDRISMNLKSAELRKVLLTIEKKSDYRFLFNEALVAHRPKINVEAQDRPVIDILNEILENTGISYKLLDNKLVVLKETSALAGLENLKDVRVTGRVTGADGVPISGASVSVKGSRVGTTTDAAGNFALTVPDDAVLVFSSVGYETFEIAVAGKTTVNATLQLSTRTIDAVVVIGYGTASKRDLTGSITKISGKEVADKPNTNPIASLQSKVAGLSVVNSGTPGDAPDIRIRGTISIGAVKPLYVVDGIFNDNIDYINPNDIESIEILKDPSSLAIFGVRGAAGVIAVTTKKAKAGQVIINLNSSYGVKKLVDKIKMANAAQFIELYEEEKVNIGVVDPFDYSKWPYDTDWIDEVTRTGKFNATNVSVSMSTDKNKFTMGAGFTQDQGIIKHEELQKLYFSVSDEAKLNNNVKVGFNFNGIRQSSPYSYARFALDDARKVAPIVPSGTKEFLVKNPYGPDSIMQNLYYLLPSIQSAGVVNPNVQLENEWNKFINKEYRAVGSLYVDINFLRNFNFRGTLYGDVSDINTRTYTPLYYGYDNGTNRALPVTTQTRVAEYSGSYKKWQQDYILTYKKSFGDHNINGTAGWTTYYFGNFNRNATVVQGTTPIPDDKRFWYIDNKFGATKNATSDQRERTTASALFRALYNYKGKYYLNASFRRDGSSQISPENRWQSFWAVGAGWELTKETFMNNVEWVNFLKLKGSIGVLGNQNTYGYDYPFYPDLQGNTAATFGEPDNVYIYLASIPAYDVDRNLKWETVHGKEIGIEADAFSRRLHFEFNYFSKVTKDLMTFIPGISGTRPGLRNIGEIKNSGIELMASWTQMVGRDLSLTVGGNLTTYNNEVLDLVSEDFSIIDGPSRVTVGYPIGYFYGYIVEGIYQTYTDIRNSVDFPQYGSREPGDLKYKDFNDDGVIDTKDRTMIGNPTPDFTYGLSVNLGYKNFEFSVDFGGVYGNEIFRNWGNTEATFQRVNYPAFKFDRWHGEGTSNWEPILGADHRINYEASTYNIEDGSYFRIRNMQLGYNIPNKSLPKQIKSLRLFVNAQNLKTWKRNEGYTPEYGGTATSFGRDDARGAIPMVTTFGINVNF